MRKKIVLYIDGMHKGGAQRVMSLLANYFSSKYDVVLINDYEVKNDAPQFLISPSVKRYFLDNTPKKAFSRNISRIKMIRKILKKEKPDVGLSFLGHPNLRFLLASKGMKFLKYVSVRNDPNHEYGSSAISRIIANRLFKRADGVVFQTKEAKTYFKERSIKKFDVILNPIDESFYSKNNDFHDEAIVSVGRLEKQKNFSLLIEAFANIANDFPSVVLRIYGEGSLKDELKSQIDVLGLSKRISLMGAVDDIPNVLSKAKIFVLSSDYEGMPNALLEAMAVGVPPISTDCPCGGPRELIDNRKTGLLVNCKDSQSMSVALKTLLTNQNLYESIRTNLKVKSSLFHKNSILKKWESFLFD